MVKVQIKIQNASKLQFSRKGHPRSFWSPKIECKLKMEQNKRGAKLGKN